jgi:NAD(P)H-dependent flavin oxidoreductase YrpB (nitropropane dioxygenase family)
MQTALTGMLGIRVPIVLAPFGGAATPRLTAAVAKAGGLGTIPLWGGPVSDVTDGVAAVRALTDLPFAVNLNASFPHLDHLRACLDLDVGLVSLFWGADDTSIALARSRGGRVMVTIGSAAEARRAVEAGADIVVAQGHEAGGHVWGEVGTLALIPAVVDAVPGVPVVAAGGIADGRGLAAVLALGASAAWIGTRFLAATESGAHPEYQDLLFAATEADTLHSHALFDGGWPDAPHRVLVNSTVRAWQDAGRPGTGARPGESERLGDNPAGAPLLRYDAHTPGSGDSGAIEAMSLWAGQGVGLVTRRQPAAEIVAGIADEAEATLRRLAQLPR